MADPPAAPPPSGPNAPAVVCFTGVHARLPQLLATIRRSGLALAVRRCTTLVDFARELSRANADLVGVDCGPGNLRLADAMAVLRRAGCNSPIVVISEPSAEARAATAGLDQCLTLAPEDLPRLADLVRRIRRDADEPGRHDPGRTDTAAALDAEAGAALADDAALTDALRRALLAGARRAALAVLRVTPEPGAGKEARLARCLGEALGNPTILARLGAGHYGALLELEDPSAGVALAHAARDQVRRSLEEPVPAAGPPNVAIGISPPRATDGGRAEAWLARAVEACAVAARAEHGYAVLSGTPVAAPSARDLPGLLQEALVSNHLILQFQPIVSLRGDARQHYETLVRLPSTTAGELLPADFFGPARASGLISAVDHWVIRHAIRRLQRERATNRRIHLFIPLAAETLADERVLVAICDELRDTQALGDWLTFQLRPTDVGAHRGRARQLVEGLRQIRCRLALEGYGGEPGSLELLQTFAFDFAKLSPALTRDLSHDPALLERVRGAVVDLERRGVKSVATGVEDSQTLAYLWTLGVDYAQGFFLQEPSATIGYEAAS